MKFEYVAVNAKGQECDGLFEAESKDEAITKLRGCGLYPIQVAQEGQLEPPIQINTAKDSSSFSENEQAFISVLEMLCDTLKNPGILTQAKLDSVQKVKIVTQITGLLEIAEKNSDANSINFSKTAFSEIYKMISNNPVLSQISLVGGLVSLIEIAQSS